jgi:hypothetical protein
MGYPIENRALVLRYVQRTLKDFSLYLGKVDGIWGPGTKAAIEEALRYTNIVRPPTSSDEAIAYFVQSQALHAGVCLKYDGYWGPDTEQALSTMFFEFNRDVFDETLDERLAFHGDWPSESEVRSGSSKFGQPGTGLTQVKIPYKLRLSWSGQEVGSVTCHKEVAEALVSVLEETLNIYGQRDIEMLGLNLYGGSYSDRAVRGGTKKSMHAWGIAFDFDPANNRLRWDHRSASFAKAEYEPWVAAWYRRGAINLGRERNYDWMHFQFARLK